MSIKAVYDKDGKLTGHRVYIKPGGRRGRALVRTFIKFSDAKEWKLKTLAEFQRDDSGLGRLFRTFGEACTYYLDTYAEPNGQKFEKYYLPYFEAFFGKDTHLEKIGQERCKELYAKMVKEFALSTVIRRWTLLVSVFRENGKYIRSNPAKGVVPRNVRVKADIQKTEYFTNDQYRALLAAEHTEDDGDIAIIFRHTGLIRNEGEKFSVDWCDFTTNTIHIPSRKGGKAASIPMLPEARTRILEIMKRKNITNGPLLNMKNIDVRFRKWVIRAGLYKPAPNNLTLYSLRHSLGTYLQQNYKDLNATRLWLRHSTTRMTIRYAHASDQLLRAAGVAASVAAPTEKKDLGIQSKVEQRNLA